MLAAAAVGGTASKLGGGKFANGAWTAAFVSRFNHDSGPKPLASEICSQEGFKCSPQSIREQFEKVASAKVVLGIHQSEGSAVFGGIAEGVCILVPNCIGMRLSAEFIEVNVDLNRVHEIGKMVVTYKGRPFGSYSYFSEPTDRYVEMSDGMPYTRRATVTEALMTSYMRFPTRVDWSYTGHNISEANLQRRSW
jgi:hypothetical protein